MATKAKGKKYLVVLKGKDVVEFGEEDKIMKKIEKSPEKYAGTDCIKTNKVYEPVYSLRLVEKKLDKK